MNFIFEVHLRRTTNPLGSRSIPEGSKIEPRGFEDRTQKGSKIEPFWVRVFEPRRVHVFEPFWVRSRTQRVRSSNPLGSTNPEGFVSSNPSGFDLEPSGFHEPRRVRRSNPPGFRTLWVRGTKRVRSRTQKGSKIRTLLGSWNAEGSKIEPSGFDLEPRRVRRHEPRRVSIFEPFWVRDRTQKGSIFEPFWVRDRTQKGSIFEPSGFNLEPRGFVVLRR
ncbi:hypothetical protein ACOSP7_019122 [Xanthoceras sorbifolium]